MRPHASIPFASTALSALALAAPAGAQPADVVVKNDSFTPKSVTINTGEAVNWDVQEGGHNVDVWKGPETFKSTSGKDASGTKFSHTFSKAGVYEYICDYHGSMKGTITVQAAPAPAPPPSNGGPNNGTAPAPAPSGSSPQPTTPSGSTTPSNTVSPSTSLGTTPNTVDAAAPSVRSLGAKANRLRLALSEDSRVVVRYVRVGARGHVVHKRITRAHKGTVRLKLNRWMRSGRYRVHVMAFDAAGNASRPVRVRLAVR